MLFLVDRANVEGVLFFLLVAVLLAYRRESFYLAATLLAIPVAMKGSAGVFWLLFLFDRRFLALLTSVATLPHRAPSRRCCSFLVARMRTSTGCESALELLLQATSEGTSGLRHSVSLKSASTDLGRLDEHFNFFVVHYMAVSIAILVGVALALALLRLELWQRVALLSAAMILVPSVSYEYRMIHVYLPLLLFLAVSERRRFDALYVVLFGLLLVPKGLPILYADVNVGTVLNPLLLVALMAAIVIDAARTRGVSPWRPGGARAAPAG